MAKKKPAGLKPIDYRQSKVLSSRKGVRKNPDGSVSTHIMANADNYAFPTLFQNPDGSWLELGFDKAFNEAKKRGELYSFNSPEEAEEFAKGSWKKYENGGQVMKTAKKKTTPTKKYTPPKQADLSEVYSNTETYLENKIKNGEGISKDDLLHYAMIVNHYNNAPSDTSYMYTGTYGEGDNSGTNEFYYNTRGISELKNKAQGEDYKIVTPSKKREEELIKLIQQKSGYLNQKRDGGQVMKKQVGTLFGSGGPYGAADVYGAANFYRNGGQVDKKELAMRLLPMLMGMPPMEEGGYLPDLSGDISALAQTIYNTPLAANMTGFVPADDKKDKKKSEPKGGAGEKKISTKDIMAEIEKKNEANAPETSAEFKKTREEQVLMEQASNFVGDDTLPAGALGTLMLPTNRYGGLTDVYGDLPEYEYGGLPVEGETNAEARERQGRQSIAGQTLGGAGTGAATGAAIGSVAGVPGAIVGGAIGGLVGGVGGFFKGKRDKREAEEYDAQQVAAETARQEKEAQEAEMARQQGVYQENLAKQQATIAQADMGTDTSGYGVDVMRMGGLTGTPQFEVEGGEVYQGKGIQQVYGQGDLVQNSKDTVKINGPQHEQGGVKMESSEGGRIFSDKLKPKGEDRTYADLADIYTKEIGEIEDRAKGGDTAAKNTAKYMKQGIEAKLDDLFNDQESIKAAKEERKAKREEKKMRDGGMLPEYNYGGYAAAIAPLYNIGKGLFSKLEYATAEEVDGVDYSKMMDQQIAAGRDAAKSYAAMAKDASKVETYNPAAELAAARDAAARTRYDMQRAGGGNLRAVMSGNLAAQRAQAGMESQVLGKKEQMDIAARQAAQQRQLAIQGQAAQQQYQAQSALAQMMAQQAQADQQAALYNAQVREKNQMYRLQAKSARNHYLDQGMNDLGSALYMGAQLSK